MNEYNDTMDTKTSTFGDRHRFERARNPKWIGLFLLVIGAILLLKQLGFLFPAWFLSWPVLLIAIGLLIGVQHRFRNRGWFFPVLIGTLFLIDSLTPGLNIKNYIWPIIIMAAGVLFILRPKHNQKWRRWSEHWDYNRFPANANNFNEMTDANDFIDITSVFGGVKKMILSKNFKGGDITNFMGGTEINLTQADITGTVVIDTTNVFGGTKIIIPPSWDVQSNIVTVFGGVDDKRQVSPEVHTTNKIIKLEGTCLFGGIDIRSF